VLHRKERPAKQEKPLETDMGFDEFLERLVRVPKSEIDEEERKAKRKQAKKKS
jgi:hypothetical protein